MALCTVRFRSESIDKSDAMNVIVPDGEGPFPVLYLLHPLTVDYTWWSRFLSIERLVEDQRLMVVMPDTHRFFYINDPRQGGLAYEDHITETVIGFVDRVFPTIPGGAGRAVAGMSMGGYGTMMLALRHPGVFSVAAAMMSGFIFACPGDPLTYSDDFFSHPELLPLSAAAQNAGYDLWQLAKEHREAAGQVALRISCGSTDPLLQMNRDFHEHLAALGIDHEYVEHEGAHDYTSSVPELPRAIDWISRRLNAE